MQDEALAACVLKQMVEEQGPESPSDPFLPLLYRWKAACYPDTQEKMAASPIANYSERSLFERVRTCGFSHVRMELHVSLLPAKIPSWAVFLESSPHPWAPPLSRVLADLFTPDERRTFESIMRPLVESGQALSTERTAYLNALKPAR